MNTLNDTNLAKQLGSLAADQPTTTSPETFGQQAGQAAAAVPTRLSAVLAHLRQRNRMPEDVAAKLRANEFLVGQ